MECANCKCVLGIESGEVPFSDHMGETWCPQCFGHKRACMEPSRYYPGGFNAVHCAGCGLNTVSIGHEYTCSQCGSPRVVLLPPKLDAGLGDTGGIRKIIVVKEIPVISK